MDRNTGNRPANHSGAQCALYRWRFAALVQNQSNKEKEEVSNLDLLQQRRADIKSRLDSLRNDELAPLVTRVESLRERIGNLEDDFRDVLDQIREEEKKARKTK
jgi:hypothetical protein